MVGFDIAGDEGSCPLNNTSTTSQGMMEALDLAKKLGVPTTVHAGEWPEKTDPETGAAPTTENLRYVLQPSSGVKRIGHGIAIRRLHLIRSVVDFFNFWVNFTTFWVTF